MTPKLQKLICDLVDEINKEVEAGSQKLDAPWPRLDRLMSDNEFLGGRVSALTKELEDHKKALELCQKANKVIQESRDTWRNRVMAARESLKAGI
jgi:dynactin complex subunit